MKLYGKDFDFSADHDVQMVNEEGMIKQFSDSPEKTDIYILLPALNRENIELQISEVARGEDILETARREDFTEVWELAMRPALTFSLEEARALYYRLNILLGNIQSKVDDDIPF